MDTLVSNAGLYELTPAAATGAASFASPWLPDGFTRQHIDTDGTRLSVAVGGHGPLLVPLQGWPQTSRAWARVVPARAQTHTVVVPDLRGTGDNDRPESGYAETRQGDIRGILASLDLDLDLARSGGRGRTRRRLHGRLRLGRHPPRGNLPPDPRRRDSSRPRPGGGDETPTPAANDCAEASRTTRTLLDDGGVNRTPHARRKLSMPVLAIGSTASGTATAQALTPHAENIQGAVAPTGHFVAEEDPAWFTQTVTALLA